MACWFFFLMTLHRLIAIDFVGFSRISVDDISPQDSALLRRKTLMQHEPSSQNKHITYSF